MRFTCNSIAIRLPHIINDSPLHLGLEPIFTNKIYFIIPDKELICSIYVNNF
jgi:hypothetical protein